MDTNTPIFSSEFITSYGDWLKTIGVNSLNLFGYISFNCLFIHFFERLADPNIAFGDIIENAPYYFISANDFAPSCDKKYDSDGKATIKERIRQRQKAPAVYDIMRNIESDKLIDRVIPRFFRIDKNTALPPYNYIAIPQKCIRDSTGGGCNSAISKDTYLSYFFSIITFIMWGYRQGFKMLSFWNSVLIYQSSTTASIWYQICIKFLLLFGWLVFAIIAFFTFLYSMMWGVYAMLFEHYPSADIYNCGDIFGWYWTPFISVIGNWVVQRIWYLITCLFQVIVAIVAFFVGILLWWSYIPLSMFLWIFYPIIEMAYYNASESSITSSRYFPPLSDNIKKHYTSILSVIIDIYKQNSQFIMFLMILVIYYSASITMDANFTSGVGIVAGVIGVILLFKGIMQIVHSVSK
jgi:hypothetical protein